MYTLGQICRAFNEKGQKTSINTVRKYALKTFPDIVVGHKRGGPARILLTRPRAEMLMTVVLDAKAKGPPQISASRVLSAVLASRISKVS